MSLQFGQLFKGTNTLKSQAHRVTIFPVPTKINKGFLYQGSKDSGQFHEKPFRE